MELGIYGTGRFGSFWATQLARTDSRNGPSTRGPAPSIRVKTFNRSERPVPAGCEAASLEELGRCDCVMLCVAISAVDAALDALVPHLRPGTVVMDTCSVKIRPVESMLARVPESNPVIGTHPMFGPDSARDGIEGLPFVYAPVRADEEAAARWRNVFASLGLRVIEMTPDAHDREAAMTQGVTHFLGRVLADMELETSVMATAGYCRLLEVVEQTCNDPYQLFVDLQRYNPYTPQMRVRLQESLTRMMRLLES